MRVWASPRGPGARGEGGEQAPSSLLSPGLSASVSLFIHCLTQPWMKGLGQGVISHLDKYIFVDQPSDSCGWEQGLGRGRRVAVSEEDASKLLNQLSMRPWGSGARRRSETGL